MSDADVDRETAPDASGEEAIDESGRNPTQRRMDDADEGGDEPVDAPWGSEDNESL